MIQMNARTTTSMSINNNVLPNPASGNDFQAEKSIEFP